MRVRGVALGEEADVDLGGFGGVLVEVPPVGQPGGRVPYRHLAPLVLGALGRALEDPTADAALQEHLEVPARRSPCGRAATNCRSPRSTR